MKLYHTRHTKIKLEREQEERNGFFKRLVLNQKLYEAKDRVKPLVFHVT